MRYAEEFLKELTRKILYVSVAGIEDDTTKKTPVECLYPEQAVEYLMALKTYLNAPSAEKIWLWNLLAIINEMLPGEQRLAAKTLEHLLSEITKRFYAGTK